MTFLILLFNYYLMKAAFTLPKALSLTNMKTLWLLKWFLLPWRNILVAFYWHCLSNHILTWMFKCQITSWEFSCGEECCLKLTSSRNFIFSFKEQTKAKPKDLVLCSFVPNCSVFVGKGFILLGPCQRTEMLQNPDY